MSLFLLKSISFVFNILDSILEWFYLRLDIVVRYACIRLQSVLF